MESLDPDEAERAFARRELERQQASRRKFNEMAGLDIIARLCGHDPDQVAAEEAAAALRASKRKR